MVIFTVKLEKFYNIVVLVDDSNPVIGETTN